MLYVIWTTNLSSSTYDKVYSLKRSRKDKDKDEDPSVDFSFFFFFLNFLFFVLRVEEEERLTRMRESAQRLDMPQDQEENLGNDDVEPKEKVSNMAHICGIFESFDDVSLPSLQLLVFEETLNALFRDCAEALYVSFLDYFRYCGMDM
ncbi:hypothetical protein Tco_0441575 [Tanacetum coccineum]